MRRPARGSTASRARRVAGVGAVLATLLGGQALSQPAPPGAAAPAPSAAPAPAGSAAPAPSGAASAAPPAGEVPPGSECPALPPAAAGGPPTLAIARRADVPGPPDPTPEQLEALSILQQEAETFEADAKDYRQTLDRVISHHYEEKRRRLVTVLEGEIDVETSGLKAAREEAIAELEAFVAKYSGDRAHPESTPDAMFRLAALYEEKERELSNEADIAPGEPPPEPDLSKAVALYNRIIDEFPRYRELAGVFYYLGHAFNDMGDIDKAQRVWRSLVCRNHFSWPIPESEKGEDLARLPQDHPPDWWLGWIGRHGKPIDKMVEEDGVEPNPDDEEVFEDPYPSSCQRVKQELKPGEEPRYVAEIWWRLGDSHFEEIDPYGGPFNLNRAESAYRQSMKITRPPVFGVAMYKLAWTFYKQQRYEAAVRQFVELLHYTDEQERLTGNRGADFRAEAYAYIAGSLMYVDFEGPGPKDPYIARNDIFDIEPNPAIIEEELHVALERVQNPDLVPQDKTWTIEIYKALAFEFKEYNHLHNLIELDELILAKWPMNRDAPMVQNQIAETYETLAAQTRGDERDKYQALALKARGKLVDYVATGSRIPPWVEANRDDPEAIRAAERLVRSGIRRAAADHTNSARGWVQRARTEEGEDREKAFRTALEEYRFAGEAWSGYLLQDENSEDAYESRFWWADALTNQVLIKIALDEDPSPELVAQARLVAREVRDSNEGDKYLQPAAIMVVRVAQQLVERAYEKFERSGGTEGFAKRTELKEVEKDGETTYAQEPIPQPLQEMITAFDEYIATVPLEQEPNQEKPNHDRFAYLAGEIPFFYGQFAIAKARLCPIYNNQCGQTEYAYLAWEKLITMANKDNDVEESRRLALASKKKSCALTEEQKVAQAGIADPTIQRGYFQEAAKAYEKAQNMPDGPAREAQWRKAAELYEGALKEAPERDEAPEAAILGASAYKQIGEYDKAIAMYELFIDKYGDEENLTVLKKGDAEKGTPPNKKKYEERVKYLKVAYDALAEAYVLFFDYRRAAQTFDTIASNPHFEAEDKRTAAQNAVFLYANIGDRDKVEAAKRRFFGMNPSAKEKAEIEWLIASADLKQWDQKGPNQGTNASARRKAADSVEGFYRKYNRDRAADAFTVQAAYWAAKLADAGRNGRGQVDWCKKTISAFDQFKAGAGKNEKGNSKANGTLQADMAAECDYERLDKIIAKEHDYESGHHRFKGVAADIISGPYKECVEEDAKAYFDDLQKIIDTYVSRKWAVAARARQGSLYDACRTGLYNAREPDLQLYTAKEKKLLKQLDDLCVNQGSDKACTQYDTFTAKRRTDWFTARDKQLNSTDKAMVRGYVDAIVWGRAWKVRVPATDFAIRRLAFFTEIIGDAKLREHSTGIKDPATEQEFIYQDGMFRRMRRGMVKPVEAEVLPSPLPAIPQP